MKGKMVDNLVDADSAMGMLHKEPKVLNARSIVVARVEMAE